MKKYILHFLLIISVSLQAQTRHKESSFLDKTAFKVGYYGNLIWDNGLHIGAEYLWKEKTKLKEKKKGSKTIIHQFLFNGSLGYSTNFTSQTDDGLTMYYGLSWRRTSPKRWQLQVELNPLGYYRSFLPETYEVKGDKVSKISFPGRSYYSPSIGFGFGRLAKGDKRSAWYFNFNYAIRTPYNGGALPMLSLQYGYRFYLTKK